MNHSKPDPYTGTITVEWGGRQITLRMRWKEVAALRAAFGGELVEGTQETKWSRALGKAVCEQDVETIAKAVSICSGLSVDEVMELDPAPPWTQVTGVLVELTNTAMLGPDWKTREPASKENGEDRPFGRLIRSLYGSARRPASASRPETSGT